MEKNNMELKSHWYLKHLLCCILTMRPQQVKLCESCFIQWAHDELSVLFSCGVCGDSRCEGRCRQVKQERSRSLLLFPLFLGTYPSTGMHKHSRAAHSHVSSFSKCKRCFLGWCLFSFLLFFFLCSVSLALFLVPALYFSVLALLQPVLVLWIYSPRLF